MPATRRILKHASVEIAKRTRKCHRNNKHGVRAGEACLVISDENRLGQKKNYCTACARDILDQAERDLSQLHAQLVGDLAA